MINALIFFCHPRCRRKGSQEGAGRRKRGGVKRGGERGGAAAWEGGMIVRGGETVVERARGREEAAKEQLSS